MYFDKKRWTRQNKTGVIRTILSIREANNSTFGVPSKIDIQLKFSLIRVKFLVSLTQRIKDKTGSLNSGAFLNIGSERYLIG